MPLFYIISDFIMNLFMNLFCFSAWRSAILSRALLRLPVWAERREHRWGGLLQLCAGREPRGEESPLIHIQMKQEYFHLHINTDVFIFNKCTWIIISRKMLHYLILFRLNLIKLLHALCQQITTNTRTWCHTLLMSTFCNHFLYIYIYLNINNEN